MDPLSTLEEALMLASIRNQCRFQMTNDQRKIGRLTQINWFQQIYTQQNPKYYWVWLLKEITQNNETIIGYFAAKETEQGVFITEGLLESKRGVGVGTFILKSMLSHESFKKKIFYADIFNNNSPSIYLHKKFGFKELCKVNEKTTRFVLYTNNLKNREFDKKPPQNSCKDYSC